jgi:putative transposase
MEQLDNSESNHKARKARRLDPLVIAFEAAQPIKPPASRVVSDYVHHGTLTLFAALDVATGSVFTECQPRHRHQEFLAFLRRLDDCIPSELDVHLIVDNYANHNHPKVRTWLAQRPRYQVHYTPTYSSWLNRAERWFALITQRVIRRGSFRSVKELVEKIDTFIQQYNRSHQPFVWTATADSMLCKIAPLCSRTRGLGGASGTLSVRAAGISGTAHQQNRRRSTKIVSREKEQKKG